MEHEIRFRGQLMGHWPDEESARAHYDEHFARRHPPNETENLERDVKDFAIAPKKPIELRCRGTLVDTFDDVQAAAAEVDRRCERWPRIERTAYEVTDSRL